MPKPKPALTKAESDEFASAELPLPMEHAEKPPVVSEAASAATEAQNSEETNVGPQDFELLCVIGQGAFGKVSGISLRCCFFLLFSANIFGVFARLFKCVIS